MTQQQAPVAGWYNASGDPANTLRYWDGYSWQGEPVTQTTRSATVGYELIAPAAPMHTSQAEQAGRAAEAQRRQLALQQTKAAQKRQLGSQLRYLGLRLTVLKALPLAALFAYWLRSSDDLDVAAQVSEGLWTPLQFFLVAGGLLTVQLLGIMVQRPGVTLLPSVLLTAIDGFAVVTALYAGGIIALLIVGFVAFSQLTIAIWAFSETFGQ